MFEVEGLGVRGEGLGLLDQGLEFKVRGRG